MKDIKLDLITHDLLIENFDLSLVAEIDRVVQNLKIRLWFFFQEWFLDTSEGVRFYQDIHIKNPDLNVIEALIKEEIMGTEDVLEILNFDLIFESAQRKLTVDFEVNTTFGQTTLAEVL